MREAAICEPCNALKDVQQSPGHTKSFGANNQPCPQISSVLSEPQLFLHAVFTQTRALCLSFSVPTSTTHFPYPASAFSDNWARSNQYRDLLSLPRAGHPTACVGMKIHAIHWRQAPGPCTAPLQCSSLGKSQHQRCPKPFHNINVPTAGAL